MGQLSLFQFEPCLSHASLKILNNLSCEYMNKGAIPAYSILFENNIKYYILNELLSAGFIQKRNCAATNVYELTPNQRKILIETSGGITGITKTWRQHGCSMSAINMELKGLNLSY